MITIEMDGKTIDVEYFIFNGGEVQVNIPHLFANDSPVEDMYINAKIRNSDDVMALFLTVDVVREYLKNTGTKLRLRLLYFPYARQDRRCQVGEAHSVKVFMGMINSLNFDSVEVWDIHNESSLSFLQRAMHIDQQHFVKRFIEEKEYIALVAPDAGAVPKISPLSVSHPIIFGSKIRDSSTGQITGTKVDYSPELDKTKPILIVDDIADNGMTFFYLAKVLREEGFEKVDLFVTHAIFKNGADKLFEYIDNIYTTSSFYDGGDDRINIIF